VYKPQKVAHCNKLATILTTVQVDICDGKLWTKGKNESEREREKALEGMVAILFDARRRFSAILFTNYFICSAYSN